MKRTFRFMVVGLMLLAMSLGIVANAQDGSVLVIGWEQEPPLLSPRSDLAFAALMTNFYGRDVWNWDVNRQIYPEMVEEVPTVANGMVTTLENGATQVTYKLREGMVWSDGTPITTDDCLLTHELMMDPTKATFQRGTYPEVVESFEVVDDTTFVLTYNAPWPDFQSDSYATCGTFPAHIFRPILEAEGNIDNAPFWSGQGVVGYGPYVFTEWIVGESVRFEANPLWDGQAPAFSTVILRMITDTAQMQNALEAGEIDVAFNFSDDLVPGYQAIENTEVFSTPGVFGDAIWMNYGNGGHPALADKNVRIAIISAIDRKTLAEQLVGPGTEVPKAWHSSAFWPDDLGIVEYNVDEANRLLDEAGWVDTNGDGIREKDGERLAVTLVENKSWNDWVYMMQGFLQEVGFDAEVLTTQGPSNTAAIASGEHALPAMGDVFASASQMTRDWHSDGYGTFPSGHFWDEPELDAMLVAAESETDTATRTEMYREIQHYIMENALMVPIFELYFYAAHANGLQGFVVDGTGYYKYFAGAYVE